MMIYILHLFIVVALTALSQSHNILDFCANEVFAVILLILTIPISYLLVSSPVVKATRWLVSPDFSLKKTIETIMK